jgi:phosphoglycolate phosphatase-like HAD superfamily hydrolase
LVLDWLHDRGVSVDLVSNVGQEALGKALTRLGLVGYLSIITELTGVIDRI